VSYGQFGTDAKVSLVRSFVGPKCPMSKLSVLLVIPVLTMTRILN